MRGIYVYTIALLLLSGCASNEKGRHSPASVNPLDTLDVKLPDGIRELDNLTVYPSLENPSHDIRFIEDHTYLPEEDLRFRRYDQIAAGDSGRVYIKSGLYIYAYDRDGNRLAKMGGSGQGPGEHDSFGGNDMLELPGHLLTYDIRQKRINLFSKRSLAPSGTILMDPDQWPAPAVDEGIYPGYQMVRAPMYHAWSDSLVLMRFTRFVPIETATEGSRDRYKAMETYSRYYLMNLEGEFESDSLLYRTHVIQAVARGISSNNLPLNNRSLMAVSRDQNIYMARARHFLIRIFNARGEYERAVFYPYRKHPVDTEHFISSYTGNMKKQKEYLRNSDLPESWPVLEHLLADDKNRIWASTFIDDDERLRWYLLDRRGKLLASFHWPGDRHSGRGNRGIRTVKDGFMYAYEETPGDENTLPQGRFVRYRIELTPETAGGQ